MNTPARRFETLLQGIERLVDEEGTAIRESNWTYGQEVERKKARLIESLIDEGRRNGKPAELSAEWRQTLQNILARSHEHSRMIGEKKEAVRREQAAMRSGSVRLKKLQGAYGRVAGTPAPSASESFTA